MQSLNIDIRSTTDSDPLGKLICSHLPGFSGSDGSFAVIEMTLKASKKVPMVLLWFALSSGVTLFFLVRGDREAARDFGPLLGFLTLLFAASGVITLIKVMQEAIMAKCWWGRAGEHQTCDLLLGRSWKQLMGPQPSVVRSANRSHKWNPESLDVVVRYEVSDAYTGVRSIAMVGTTQGHAFDLQTFEQRDEAFLRPRKFIFFCHGENLFALGAGSEALIICLAPLAAVVETAFPGCGVRRKLQVNVDVDYFTKTLAYGFAGAVASAISEGFRANEAADVTAWLKDRGWEIVGSPGR
jgi:hypothetical protein